VLRWLGVSNLPCDDQSGVKIMIEEADCRRLERTDLMGWLQNYKITVKNTIFSQALSKFSATGKEWLEFVVVGEALLFLTSAIQRTNVPLGIANLFAASSLIKPLFKNQFNCFSAKLW
jgi:hypothetical protein